MGTKSIQNMTFEEALAELEELSSRMSQGGLSLNDSVEAYARGVELSRHCRKLLDTAQRKIQQLDGELSDLTENNLKSDSNDVRF